MNYPDKRAVVCKTTSLRNQESFDEDRLKVEDHLEAFAPISQMVTTREELPPRGNPAANLRIFCIVSHKMVAPTLCSGYRR